jgi:hypothetical protein
MRHYTNMYVIAYCAISTIYKILHKHNIIQHTHPHRDYYTFSFRPLAPLWNIWLISQFLDHFTDVTTPWTGDQLVARRLHKHRTTQTQNRRIHTPNIPASERAKISTCFRYLGSQIHTLLQRTSRKDYIHQQYETLNYQQIPNYSYH